MKILVLAAMTKEIELLKEILSNKTLEKYGKEEIWKGEIGNNTVYLAKCGIGKVNSALNTLLFSQFIHPDLIINSGVAGGAGTPIGSVLVADKVAYHDVWCGPGTDYGQIQGLPLYLLPEKKILEIVDFSGKEDRIIKGLICSGDKFISTKNEIDNIRNHFPDVKAVDMESASIAQTAILNNIPFAIIRVISDTPGEGENISQYKDFWTQAPLKTFHMVKSIIKNLQ